MAIGIDGYNTVFRNFAQFAQRCSDGGISKAVITAEEGRPLNGRRVVSISNTLMDSVYVMRRGAEQETAKAAFDGAAEMDRLAGLDFSKFDDAEARGLLDGAAPNKLRTIYDGFPPEYRLNLDGARCYCDFKPTLN